MVTVILVQAVSYMLTLLHRFGESVDILHPLDQPFTASSGASIIQNLSFSQTKTNFVQVQHINYYLIPVTCMCRRIKPTNVLS